jgi:hypothetical protein
MQISQ